MDTFFLERTANGLSIPAHRFGHEGPSALILGGVHGDEHEGVEATVGLVARWSAAYTHRVRTTVVPALNLDGVLRHRRANGNGVDLNRNMATRDWSPSVANPRYHPGPSANSEPETRALISLIEKIQPKFILSLHSWHPLLNVNGDCLPEAESLARWTGYTIRDSIGYPTPGCLGTYCGLERGIPTLTYELERGMNTRDILETHVTAIDEALKITEQYRTKAK